MEKYLIIARSVTYAQRMQRALERGGIRSQIFRAPRELTDAGCAYAVQVQTNELSNALLILHQEHFSPVRIFLIRQGFYQEVAP